ncbi:MAG: S41 family peptidase [bacterium]|nr:S41 family peptidase [bacterium]
MKELLSFMEGDGIDDEQYVYPTVNDQGKLVYGLFCMNAEGEEFPESIRLVSEDGETSTLDMVWTIVCAGPQYNNLDVSHEYYEKDGIPVTTLTRMSIDFHDVKMTNEFINEAKKLRDEPIFILDLRDNTGGLNEIADFFLYNLTGDKCEAKMQLATRYSAINQNIEKAISETKKLSDFSEVDFYQDNQELVNGWTADRERGGQARTGETVVIDNHAKWNDYENTIVVLVNQKTKAAAEYFLMKLSTVSNVVIIGTNTAGYMITDSDIDAEDIYLQYTGIPVNYGPTLVLHDKMEDFDTTGWIPDIVTRGDALDAATALLRN